MLTGASGISHLEQPQTQGVGRNQDVHGDGHPNGDGRPDFRSYESPFSRRVKEKARRVQAHSEDSPRERSKPTAELPSAKNVGRRYELEIQGDDSLHRTFHRTLLCPQ